MRGVMDGAKKSKVENPINDKIQTKFDLIFTESDDDKNILNEQELDGDISMSNSAQKKPEMIASSLILDLDQDATSGTIEFDSSAASEKSNVESKSKLAILPDANDLEFSLDFGDDEPEIPSAPASHGSPASKSLEIPAFESSYDSSDSNDELDAMFDAAIEESKNSVSEGTQKTIVFDKSKLSAITSIDLLTTEEAKENIELTIKEIVRPKNLDSTQEIDLSGLIEADELIEGQDFSSFSMDNEKSNTGDFDLSSVEFTEKAEPMEDIPKVIVVEKISAKVISNELDSEIDYSMDSFTAPPVLPVKAQAPASYESVEDSSRVQATIRQLREEREEILNQIKKIKGDNRELEQDNLTLKAALDESKIEVSILRKRHLVELEDIKYRFSLNEEKKAMAEEKARLAEGKREKLEQRVRIDFSQVKQREKELESKLEMLSIDIDSQVQSRDQKILELRRKIDSLEFNMENVSIKEHKSQDDKRKLEDKLNKIMKTLRHSIKNLEDDIELASDDEHIAQAVGQRSGKV
jgi:hypothetical protein